MKIIYSVVIILYLILYPASIFSVITEDKQSSQNLSLHFNQISVKDLLELLAEFKGVNLVISEAVTGAISIHLNNVTWAQALDTILTMQGLGLRKKGSILFIASSAEIEVRKNEDADGSEMRSEIFRVHYANATAVSDLIKANRELLSEKGSVLADARTNILWLKDTPEKLEKIKYFLHQIDLPAKQVRIKAHIVNIDQSSIKELGLKFSTVNDSQAQKGLDRLYMDMPVTIQDMGHFSIAIAKLGNNTLLNLELSALEKEGHARVISKPELMTADRQIASIESGQEIPYQENTSSGATNTSFKKAVLSLKVTPIVTPDDKILLNLLVNQDKVSDLVVNGVPAISTQQVETQILVKNGETVVLGGIYEENSTATNERIPFWSSVPVLGALFQSKTSHVERRELLIFVQPEIITGGEGHSTKV